MGWLFDILFDFVSDAATNAVARRIGLWGCLAILGALALAVLLILWLT